jgi:hypothetical protein
LPPGILVQKMSVLFKGVEFRYLWYFEQVSYQFQKQHLPEDVDFQLLVPLDTNFVAPETKDLSLYSQEPATDSYSEPTESTPPPPPTNLPNIHIDHILLSTPQSSKWPHSLPTSLIYVMCFIFGDAYKI